METSIKHYKVDKNSPLPMYFQIKQEIRKAIKQGIYKSGDQLPTELEYCKALDVSRPTIRQALQELINEGYITRHKGKGTFVAKPKMEGTFFKVIESFNDEIAHLGMDPSTNVLHQEVEVASEDVAKALQLQPNEKVFHIVRLRFVDKEPVVYSHTYVPYTISKKIETEDFSDNGVSLYHLLENKYGVKPKYVDRTIEAFNGNTDICTLLDIEEGQVVLHFTTIAYTKEDVPIEYTISKFRGDRCKFSVRLTPQ